MLAGIGGGIGVAVDYFNLRWAGVVASLFLIAMMLFAIYLSRVRVYEAAGSQNLDRGSVTPLVADFMFKSRAIEVMLDLALVSIAYYTSYRLRFEGDDFDRNFSVFYRTLAARAERADDRALCRGHLPRRLALFRADGYASGIAKGVLARHGRRPCRSSSTSSSFNSIRGPSSSSTRCC